MKPNKLRIQSIVVCVQETLTRFTCPNCGGEWIVQDYQKSRSDLHRQHVHCAHCGVRHYTDDSEDLGHAT